MGKILLLCALLLACADESSSRGRPTGPERPAEFEIELREGPCYGSCPTVSMRIDQTGLVTYVGERCVERAGVFQKQVSAAVARQLYERVRSAGLFSMRDSYTSEADGCDLWTDQPTYEYLVKADGASKRVRRYLGCEGNFPELSRLDALAPEIEGAADVSAWIGPTTKYDCDVGQVIDATYQLSNAGQPVGVLSVKQSQGGRWSVADCAGEQVSEGRFIPGGPTRGDLLGDGERLLAFPGDERTWGGARLEAEGEGTRVLRLLDAESELSLTAVPGHGC
jgi:hypothetical protein